MFKSLKILVAVIIFTGSVFPSPVTEVRAALDGQVAAWNAGDLEKAMEFYWNCRTRQLKRAVLFLPIQNPKSKIQNRLTLSSDHEPKAPLLTKEGWQPHRLTGWFSLQTANQKLPSLQRRGGSRIG